ncbi:MAG TPA: L,D-transpeptidase family protein [Candidatus Angelobacter sp.]
MFSRRQVWVVIIALAAFAAAPLRPDKPAQADAIVVVKTQRTLTLLHNGKQLKRYKVALGGDPLGPKTRQGDNKTPEGVYTIDSRNPHSQFHLALHVSYPNAADRERARKLGVSPGGDIMIHGLPPQWASIGAAHRQSDWTLGCIAVTNPEIEEIWALAPVGTKVEIRP